MVSKDEDAPARTLFTALGAMALVAVVVGLVIGAVAVGALKVAGVGGGDGPNEAAPASLYLPQYSPTPSSGDDLIELPSISASPSPTDEEPTEAPPKRNKITLFVAPQAASPGQRINFNGVYLNGEGVALRVQRKEGDSWTDFADVTATVRGGSFTTWIQTSRTGEARFRVYDPSADRGSNVVVVTIG